MLLSGVSSESVTRISSRINTNDITVWLNCREIGQKIAGRFLQGQKRRNRLVTGEPLGFYQSKNGEKNGKTTTPRAKPNWPELAATNEE